MKEFRLNIIRLFFSVCSILMMASCNEKKQFDGYLYPIRENGLYGFIDSVGNRIIEPEFLWVSTFHNGLAMVVVDTIYREVQDSMAYEVGECDTVFNVYRLYAKYGYIDRSGKLVIEPKFVSYVNMNEIGDVTNDMDDCSNALYRHSFRNGRAMFCDTTTWRDGYIDTNGNVAIKPKYYYSEPFSEGLAVVRDAVAEPLYTNTACITPSKLRCAYLDTLGNAVTEFKYESLTRFSSGRGIGTYKKINKETLEIEDTTIVYETYSIPRFLINREGKEIKELNFNYDYYGFSRNGISVSSDGFFYRSFIGKENISYYFIDINGDFLEPLKGLSEYQLDSLGKCNDIIQVLPENAKISAATYFNDGYAGVSPDKKHWFVIDKYLIIHGYGKESVFDDYRAFNNGLAAVKKNGKWGFINRKIKEQIPCKYDSCGTAYPYLEEIFEYDMQKNVKKIAYINRKDSTIWESNIPKPEEISNEYSSKDKKDWGKWTYKYNPFLEIIRIWMLLALGSLLIIIIIIIVWRFSAKRKTDNQVTKLTTNPSISIQSEVDNDAITSQVEDESIRFYPSVGTYEEIIKLASKSPEDYFEKLSNLRPVFDKNGNPIMSSGNFAVVFKMVDEKGIYHALRCFHRGQDGRGRSYKLICEELEKVSSTFILPIKYLEKELLIGSVEYPVLLMDWVEGLPLDRYIRIILSDNKRLCDLTNKFRELALWLLNQPFAHGDLKPENILVREDGSLVLVDYDGMYVPKMLGQRAREMGSPDFTNPSRTETDFDKDIDTFSILSILISLELLIVNKDYLSRFGAEDRLLFSHDDYVNLEQSIIYKIAYVSNYDDVSDLAVLMKQQIQGIKVNSDYLESRINGDSWIKEMYVNDIVEKPLRIIFGIYTMALFVFPFIMRSAGWSLLETSLILLLANMCCYIILNLVDMFRPFTKHHIQVLGDNSFFGCLGMIAIFIPILLMTDLVSEYLINQSKLSSFLNIPSYNDEWYFTLLNWAVWYFSFMLYLTIVTDPYKLRLKFYKTKKEKKVDQEEEEKNIIQDEIKKEEEMRRNELDNRKKKKF